MVFVLFMHSRGIVGNWRARTPVHVDGFCVESPTTKTAPIKQSVTLLPPSRHKAGTLDRGSLCVLSWLFAVEMKGVVVAVFKSSQFFLSWMLSS